MRVLIACEFSGIVREAFRSQGHDAWSCDLLETEIPGQHIKGDVLSVLDQGWDLMIAHPPCTYLTAAGNAWLNQPSRKEKREEALQFFMALYNAPIQKICCENPVGYISTAFRKYDQIIDPFDFGDPERKRTCLWLKNLPKLYAGCPPLFPGTIIEPVEAHSVDNVAYRKKKRHFTDSQTGKDRAKKRSKTFPGIAKAMAEQWG